MEVQENHIKRCGVRVKYGAECMRKAREEERKAVYFYCLLEYWKVYRHMDGKGLG